MRRPTHHRRNGLRSRRVRCAARCGLSVVGMVFAAANESAANTWINVTADARWSTDSNWQENAQPTLNFPAFFPAGFPNGDSSIGLDPGEVAASLTLEDNYTLVKVTGGFDGTLQLRDGGLTVPSGKSATVGVSLTGTN